jgi:hypothetical protein
MPRESGASSIHGHNFCRESCDDWIIGLRG